MRLSEDAKSEVTELEEATSRPDRWAAIACVEADEVE